MIWKYLGFERNIFFVEPLAPRKEDIELFVGRVGSGSRDGLHAQFLKKTHGTRHVGSGGH